MIQETSNSEDLAKKLKCYFKNSYEKFLEFGGPSVHFHNLCMEECRSNFLSDRHVELIYATLTGWGMHRMGPPQGKLTCWEEFHKSILCHKEDWSRLRKYNVTEITLKKYIKILQEIKGPYLNLNISRSNQTIVAHSKTLFHIVPDLIPPIDREYTMNFFNSGGKTWTDSSGKEKRISKNTLGRIKEEPEAQFNMFLGICVNVKKLGDELSWKDDPDYPDHATPLKAIDNAIVNFMKTN